MMGLDTNVLVRYLTRDEETQARAADRIIDSAEDSGAPLFVGHIVLCELAWVLRGAYGLERARVEEVLARMLETDAFRIEDRDAVLAALEDYRRSGADFADCLIGRRNRGFGCEATLTFDARAARLPGFRALTTT